MKNAKHTRVYTNRLFRRITYIYATVLLIMGFLASYLSINNAYNVMISQLDQNMIEINHAYEKATEEFWRIYMPVFEQKESVYNALETFFKCEDRSQLLPIEKRNLLNALQILLNNDDRIKWVGVYAGKEDQNFLLFKDALSLTVMPEDFPFLEELESAGSGKQILPSRLIQYNGTSKRYFALCGGAPTSFSEGKLIFGLDTQTFNGSFLDANTVDATYYIENEYGYVFASADRYDTQYDLSGELPFGLSRDENGSLVYIHALVTEHSSYSVYCVVPWQELMTRCCALVPFIAAVVLFFWLCARLLYCYAGRVILRKINAIHYGLEKIGENELDYRIPVQEVPLDEFEEISKRINDVAGRLQENIRKVYSAKIKQKEAELSELQSRFNPHFLYNSLEVIRGRAFENGDSEMSDVLVKLSQIFRNFVGAEPFATIQDEMEFCNLYLSLLKYRYENEVRIILDVDTDIMRYGIIRNLLQPILENYYVHGFKKGQSDNELILRGKMKDKDHIFFQIRDNGLGMTDERLNELKSKLEVVEKNAKSSYGLKSVHKRIRLFYGEECGLDICRNEEGGVTVELVIRKMTYEEHEARMYADEGAQNND